MLSVQRAREFFSTLRFRLVLWTTLIVFLMVVITNIAVREVEQRALRQSYDQFLFDSLEDVHQTVARFEPDTPPELFAELKDKVRANENRSWFLQIFNAKKKPIWESANAPPLAPPGAAPDVQGPYDEKKHRVYE